MSLHQPSPRSCTSPLSHPAHKQLSQKQTFSTSFSSSSPALCCVPSRFSPDSLHPYGLQPARLLCPWWSPGKNTGVGCHVLLQGIFPTQGWNPHLWQVDSLPLMPPGKPCPLYGTEHLPSDSRLLTSCVCCAQPPQPVQQTLKCSAFKHDFSALLICLQHLTAWSLPPF